MGFLKVFGLEKEKNEIGSYKYDKGLQILEDLDEYCIGGSHFFVKKEANNIFDIEIGIKIGKYEIGGLHYLIFIEILGLELITLFF